MEAVKPSRGMKQVSCDLFVSPTLHEKALAMQQLMREATKHKRLAKVVSVREYERHRKLREAEVNKVQTQRPWTLRAQVLSDVVEQAKLAAKNRPASLVDTQRKLALTPLRQEIRRWGVQLQERRAELFDALEQFGVDPFLYESWTVAELEQRVAALPLEVERAELNAVLLEMGVQPAAMSDLSNEELEGAFLSVLQLL